MGSANDAVDRFASAMDTTYGSVENFAQQSGLQDLFTAGRDLLQQADPVAAQTVDRLFGAAKIALDQDGNGQIQFSELADVAKDAMNLNPQAAAFNPAQQFQAQLAMSMMQMQLQMMAAPWTGFGGNNSGGGGNPFLMPLQNAVLRTLSQFKI